MKTIFFSIMFLLIFSLKAQIQPFTNYNWSLEKIQNIDGSQIFTDQSQ